jgi:hypothetical protein
VSVIMIDDGFTTSHPLRLRQKRGHHVSRRLQKKGFKRALQGDGVSPDLRKWLKWCLNETTRFSRRGYEKRPSLSILGERPEQAPSEKSGVVAKP